MAALASDYNDVRRSKVLLRCSDDRSLLFRSHHQQPSDLRYKRKLNIPSSSDRAVAVKVIGRVRLADLRKCTRSSTYSV